MTIFRRSSALPLAAALLLAAAAIHGCSDASGPEIGLRRNVVHGRVLGGLMRAVSNAEVTLTTELGEWRTRTSVWGFFAFEGLPDGVATLTAAKNGDTVRMLIDMSDPQPIGHTVRLPRFRLAWSDDFEGTELDRRAWFAWDSFSEHPDQLGRYLPEQVSVENGMLRIRSDAARPDGLHPTGAVVSSYHQRYGRIEIRARLPATQGLWPAHWTANGDSVAPVVEIDIMEMLGHNPRKVYFHNHWETSIGFTSGVGGSWSGDADLSADFHVYRVDWLVGVLIWYVDGVERYRTSTMVPDRAAMLRLSTQVGGNWPGPPDETTRFPQFHDIDWVRIYRLEQ